MQNHANTKNKKRRNLQRETILKKSGEIFWRYGFESSTIKILANACKFDAGNLYYYYKNKEEILYEVMKLEANSLLSRIEAFKQKDGASASERLTRFITTHIEFASSPRKSFLLFDTGLKNLTKIHKKEIVQLRDSYEQILRGIISDGIQSGEFKNTDIKIASIAIASIILRTRLWFSPGKPLTISQLGDLIADFAIGMLRKQ
jgi:AcrR family transcriptional regulator